VSIWDSGRKRSTGPSGRTADSPITSPKNNTQAGSKGTPSRKGKKLLRKNKKGSTIRDTPQQNSGSVKTDSRVKTKLCETRTNRMARGKGVGTSKNVPQRRRSNQRAAKGKKIYWQSSWNYPCWNGPKMWGGWCLGEPPSAKKDRKPIDKSKKRAMGGHSKQREPDLSTITMGV